MKCSKLTPLSEAIALCCVLLFGCSRPEVTNAAPPALAVDLNEVEDDEDAGREADDDEEEDEEEQPDEEPPRGPADAGKADAGDGGDAGKSKKPRDEDAMADAGDGGDGAAVACVDYVDRGDSDVDLLECEQFDSSDCDSYAADICQGLHFLMDGQVFRAFVECVVDTPGLDFCDEDRSAILDCEAEAKTKACTTHQPACEAYEGCETMSVDECDHAVAVFSSETIEMFGDLYTCDTSPTYFF